MSHSKFQHLLQIYKFYVQPKDILTDYVCKLKPKKKINHQSLGTTQTLDI